MSTLFTKIINREVPGFFIYEDDICAVFLDKFPAIAGQCVVVPKAEVDYIFNLPDETYLHICAVAKLVAQALDTVYQTERTCVVVEGFEVPHTHIKLYPMTEVKPLGSILPNQKEASDEELSEAAQRIAATLEEQVTPAE